MKTARCSSCDEEIIWMWTVNDKRIPVDADSVEEDETEYAPGHHGEPLFDPELHVTHFRTCPDANQHRR